MRCQCGQCVWPSDAFQLCFSDDGARYSYVVLGQDESALVVGACGSGEAVAVRAECVLFPRFSPGRRWVYFTLEGVETGIRRVDTETLAVEVVTGERDWCPTPVGEGAVAFFRLELGHLMGMDLATRQTVVLSERPGVYQVTGHETGFVLYHEVINSGDGVRLREGRCAWAGGTFQHFASPWPTAPD